MAEKNIVILGGSWAGMSTAHYVLRHVINSLPTADGSKYKVIIITPSTHFFHRVAGPRAIVIDTLPEDKFIVSLEDNFKQYKSETYALIQGKATAVDTAARTVTYALTSDPADVKTIPYHALVIATGITTTVKAWSNEGPVSELRANLADMRKRISTAKSVIIAGGGPAGVETAGEIGEQLNGAAGFFASRPSNPKAKVTLIQADGKLLPVLREALAKKAEHFLNRVGVDVVYNTKVVSTSTLESGKTAVTLSNGETLECDVYIPATGVLPNTDYLPKELLDAKGRVKTNPKTLRVDAAGPRVYAVGDAGNYSRGAVHIIYEAVPVISTNLQRDLQAYTSAEDESLNKPQGPDREFKEDTSETQFVPVGRSKGVAAVMGWKLPSFLVWLAKGRDFLLWSVPPITSGDKWKSESKWKPE